MTIPDERCEAYMVRMGQAVKRALKGEADPAVEREAQIVPSMQHSRILVVDDNTGVRQTVTLLLAAAGYRTASAQNGFEALQSIKREPPTLLLCGLDMPDMSGFELLTIVRRKFPKVAVIAMSGSYDGDAVPEGVLADAFYSKGQKKPPELFRIVADVIRKAPWRVRSHENERALIWAHRIGRNMAGMLYALVTCTDCLRSFVVTISEEETKTVREARCRFCNSEIQYISEPPYAVEDRELFSMMVKGDGSSMKALDPLSENK